MANAKKSIKAAFDFAAYWLTQRTKCEMPNGNFKIEADVAYTTPNGNLDERGTVVVTRHAVNGGYVTLLEGFDPNEVYTQFKPEYQTYTYDQKTHFLIVTGTGDKVGGDWKVTIMPV